MMGKTHIAVGIATAMVLTQPKTKTEFVATIIGGAIGGVMSDIDVKIDRSNRYAQKASMDALYGEIGALFITIAAIMADVFFGGELVNRVVQTWQTAILGAIAFAVLTVIGELSNHRDRTHSILAMILFTIAVGCIDMNVGVAFFAGYLSHLLIDLLNKSPERLFYPLKKGICFKICYADRLGNELLFAIGAGFSTLYTLFFLP